MPVPGLTLAQQLLLAVAPHGGQLVARRNAWSAMVADAQRGRASREAADALDAAASRAAARAVPGRP